MGGAVLTQAQIEDGIETTVGMLESLTNDYARAQTEAAMAEAEYRLRYWRTFLAHKDSNGPGTRGPSDKECEGRAIIANEDAFRAYKITAAAVESIKGGLTTHRTRLDSLRTLAANVRAQT